MCSQGTVADPLSASYNPGPRPTGVRRRRMTNPGRKSIDLASSAVTMASAASVTIERPSRPVILLAFASILFVVLFWRLGTPSFWDPDEAHYAQTTRELIERGDWLAPYYNQQPFFDKPIFFHVLQALPMSLFGPSEVAARLGPALAAPCPS